MKTGLNEIFFPEKRKDHTTPSEVMRYTVFKRGE